MSRSLVLATLMTAAAALPAWAGEAPVLRGSPGSMVRQHEVAIANDYTFLRNPSEVRAFAEKGYLVRVKGNDDFKLANVSFPYARPAVATFIARLGEQYRDACGERMVVTSLTRPLSEQPSNAHELSVHPAGMAVDLRVSTKAACRSWLEATLLSLESKGLLDVTREHRPPHYHVAVFPDAYGAYVARMEGESADDEPVAATPQAPSEEIVEAGPVATLLQAAPDPMAGDHDAAGATLLAAGALATLLILAVAVGSSTPRTA